MITDDVIKHELGHAIANSLASKKYRSIKSMSITTTGIDSAEVVIDWADYDRPCIYTQIIGLAGGLAYTNNVDCRGDIKELDAFAKCDPDFVEQSLLFAGTHVRQLLNHVSSGLVYEIRETLNEGHVWTISPDNMLARLNPH